MIGACQTMVANIARTEAGALVGTPIRDNRNFPLEGSPDRKNLAVEVEFLDAAFRDCRRKLNGVPGTNQLHENVDGSGAEMRLPKVCVLGLHKPTSLTQSAKKFGSRFAL